MPLVVFLRFASRYLASSGTGFPTFFEIAGACANSGKLRRSGRTIF